MKRVYYATDYAGILQDNQVGVAYSQDDCDRIEKELSEDETIESFTWKEEK